MNKFYFNKERLKTASFSFFLSPITNINPEDTVNIFDIYDAIKNDNKSLTRELRTLTNKASIADYKKNKLYYVTFSGTFSQRKDNDLVCHSNLICIDIDGLSNEKLCRIIMLLKSDPHLIMFFISPSGTGLKIIYPIDIDDMSHEEWYKEYADHLIESCNLPESTIDMSCKNLSRPCFICHDPEVFLNPAIENGDDIYPLESNKKENLQISYAPYVPYEFDFNKGVNLTDRNDEHNFFMMIKKTEIKHGGLRKGSRHNWLVSLAGNCNVLGMELDACKEYILKHFSQHPEIIRVDDPMSLREIIKPFQNIYLTHSEQFDKLYNNINSSKNKDSGNTDLIPIDVYLTLPKFLNKLCEHFSGRDRDVFFVGLIGTLSSCFKNVLGRYSKMSFHPNLYLFVTAPAGSGKSMIRFAERIVRPIHDLIHNNSLIAIQEYVQKKKEYDQDKSLPHPGKRPAERLLFMPGNSSGAAMLQTIAENEGSGMIFETEADTLTSAISKEWGDFSDFIRKAFQHETVSYKRKTGNEYVEIPNPKLSIILSGTPNQVSSLIKNVENGLFSRFLFYAFENDVVWKNPFEESNELEFEQLINKSSDVLIEYYNCLDKYANVTFKLTNSQIAKFNQSFTVTLSDFQNALGDEIIGSVFRLGIIAFRIAMLLSVFRMFEDGTVSNSIICSDLDFDAALTITNILKAHTAFVFENNMSDVKAKLKPEPLRYYQALPENFSRNEADNIATRIGLHPKTGEKYLNSYISQDIITRIKHGHYAKKKIEAL